MLGYRQNNESYNKQMYKKQLIRSLIFCELCKKVKFDHTSKMYIQKPESALEIKTHKSIRDFEIKQF